jgi:hypothetical protein
MSCPVPRDMRFPIIIAFLAGWFVRAFIDFMGWL